MGQVVLFHVLEEVAAKSPSGKTIVDIAKYRPMSRLGGNFYGCVTKVQPENLCAPPDQSPGRQASIAPPWCTG